MTGMEQGENTKRYNGVCHCIFLYILLFFGQMRHQIAVNGEETLLRL